MFAARDATASVTDLLRSTLPDVWWWDILRWISAVSTLLLACFYLRIAFGERPQADQERKTIRIGILSFLCAMLPLGLTEVEQLGMPIVPWRLPMVALMNVFGWWYVARRL